MRAPLVLMGLGALALLFHRQANAAAPETPADETSEPGFFDEISASVSETANRIMGTSASTMAVSSEMRERLKARERFVSRRYDLGDGGTTIGYGHFTRYGASDSVGDEITREEGEALFDADLESRAMRWVRAYVTAPLTQSQFDALVSMAFNMSPGAFNTIAAVVNRGEDPRDIAMRYTRPDLPHLHQGLINRREEELAFYSREGVADLG